MHKSLGQAFLEIWNAVCKLTCGMHQQYVWRLWHTWPHGLVWVSRTKGSQGYFCQRKVLTRKLYWLVLPIGFLKGGMFVLHSNIKLKPYFQISTCDGIPSYSCYIFGPYKQRTLCISAQSRTLNIHLWLFCSFLTSQHSMGSLISRGRR